jgi:hypothetical protein
MGGQYAPDSVPARENRGVRMLRILQPILQLTGGSASAGLSHKNVRKTEKLLMIRRTRGGQLSPDYPLLSFSVELW